MHSRCKSCLYCRLVQYVSLGEAPPIKGWKRPVLLAAGVSLTVCTVLGLRFAWDGVFFATVSTILMMLALLGVAISFRGCDVCVARFLGRTL
jgi:hypothetical protein